MVLACGIKRSSSDAELTNYAAKLPKFPKSGNYVEDEQNKTHWTQLQTMITACQEEPKLVPLLFGKFSEAKKQLAREGDWESAELFHPPPKNLLGLPDEFVVEFVQRRSDLKTTDLTSIQKQDPKGVHKIFLMMCQLPANMKLEGNLLCRGMLRRICESRDDTCGQRMAKVKEGGHFQAGALFWADCGAYRGRFEAGKLVEVTHVSSGDKAAIDPMDMLISSKWTLVDNYSDMAATYQFKNQPGVRLCGLFTKEPAKGPWKVVQYSGSRASNFLSFVEKELAAFKTAREAITGKGTAAEIKTACDQVKNEKKRKALDQAKVAAKAALVKAKELRQAKGRGAGRGQ